MKGIYASPDTVLEDAMNRALFPGNCYGFDSGGNPEHITELTYERYLESHARFYHPSNSRIILDGKLKMTEVARDYNLVITTLEKPLTLNEFLSYQLGGFPVVGDRFTLIDIRLYVQETQEDKITKIGYEKLDSI